MIRIAPHQQKKIQLNFHLCLRQETCIVTPSEFFNNFIQVLLSLLSLGIRMNNGTVKVAVYVMDVKKLHRLQTLHNERSTGNQIRRLGGITISGKPQIKMLSEWKNEKQSSIGKVQFTFIVKTEVEQCEQYEHKLLGVIIMQFRRRERDLASCENVMKIIFYRSFVWAHTIRRLWGPRTGICEIKTDYKLRCLLYCDISGLTYKFFPLTDEGF